MRISFFLAFLTISKAGEIQENLIKFFPAFAESNDPRICSGIALNENYFITTQICAAQTSRWIYVYVLTAGSTKPKLTNLTLNKEFTVGWNNNIVVGKMPTSSSFPKLEKLKILPLPTVPLQQNVYTLIGFRNPENSETFEADVIIQDSKICKNAKFSANRYYTFNETTEICAEVFVGDNNLNTLNYGSVIFDKSQKNIIGILSIMENNFKKPEKILIVLTRLSAYCSYIKDRSDFKCS
uniref:Peptidase S1 domain-containing protein n=1 Tax=Panagrolaimus sp. PS1159 TaxID=55785 RepID=A0AC35FTK5_9BILA